MDKVAEQLINKLVKSKVDIINTPKDLLLDFLFSNGVPKSHLETVYQVLLNKTKPKKNNDTRNDNPVINPVVNNKEVKGRKDVFGEIKRIA